MAKKINYGTHRLVNKKTGKLASSTNWLLDLAACAVAKRHKLGLPSLLPQAKAKKLLKSNALKSFKKHASKQKLKTIATTAAEYRIHAEAALPAIAVFYSQKVFPGHSPEYYGRGKFVSWIVSEMANPNSKLSRHVIGRPDLHEIHELQRGERWWLDRIKMQSK